MCGVVKQGGSLETQQPGYFLGAGCIGTLRARPRQGRRLYSRNCTVGTNISHSEPLLFLGFWEWASLEIWISLGDLGVQPHCEEGDSGGLWLGCAQEGALLPLPWVSYWCVFPCTEGWVPKSGEAFWLAWLRLRGRSRTHICGWWPSPCHQVAPSAPH